MTKLPILAAKGEQEMAIAGNGTVADPVEAPELVPVLASLLVPLPPSPLVDPLKFAEPLEVPAVEPVTMPTVTWPETQSEALPNMSRNLANIVV